MHDMLCGSPPFTGNNRKIVSDRVLKSKLKLGRYLTPNAKDILTKLLSKKVGFYIIFFYLGFESFEFQFHIPEMNVK